MWGRSRPLTSAAAPRQGGGLAPIALRGALGGRDRDAGPEARLALSVLKAAHPGAGIGAAGIPADDVEAAAAERVDPVGVAAYEADSGVARSTGVDEQGADPLLGLARQVADHRERDRAPVRAVPVERHADPGALQVLAGGVAFSPGNRGADAVGPRRGDPARRRTASPAESATRQAPPNAAAARSTLRTEPATGPVVDEFVESFRLPRPVIAVEPSRPRAVCQRKSDPRPTSAPVSGGAPRRDSPRYTIFSWLGSCCASPLSRQLPR